MGRKGAQNSKQSNGGGDNANSKQSNGGGDNANSKQSNGGGDNANSNCYPRLLTCRQDGLNCYIAGHDSI